MSLDALGAALANSVGGTNPTAMGNFGQGLESLGFMGTPGASPLMNWQDLEGFQRALKNIMDIQMTGYDAAGTPNFNWGQMPSSLRNIYTRGMGLLEDPMYGIMGTNAMMHNGYVTGELPNYHSQAYETFYNMDPAHVNAPGSDWTYYPIVHPPAVTSGGGGGGGGGGSHPSSQSGTSLYNVPISGPNGSGNGTIQVVAHDAASAVENAHQGGNTPTGPATAA